MLTCQWKLSIKPGVSVHPELLLGATSYGLHDVYTVTFIETVTTELEETSLKWEVSFGVTVKSYMGESRLSPICPSEGFSFLFVCTIFQNIWCWPLSR